MECANPTCGKPIQATRIDAKFCSSACRQQAYRDRRSCNSALRVKALRKAASIAASREWRRKSREALPLPDGMDFRVGDCRVVLNDIKPDSAAVYLADPPYGHAAEELCRFVAGHAARTLMPGGSLLYYSDKLYMPRDMAILCAHLTWHTFVVLLYDQQQRFHGTKYDLGIGNRPILWFTKGSRADGPYGGRTVFDTIRTESGRSKDEHPLSLGDGGVKPLVETLSNAGDLVVEPFAAMGDWGRIITGLGMGRRWIGCDIVRPDWLKVAA